MSELLLAEVAAAEEPSGLRLVYPRARESNLRSESRYAEVLERLRHAAVDEYGADRASEAAFCAALEVAARQLALVAQEPLDLNDLEPYRD
jgi:hypothetical protein